MTEGGAITVPTIRAILKAQQPEVYERLIAPARMQATPPPPKVSASEIKSVMRHNSYRRTRGGIKQIRQG